MGVTPAEPLEKNRPVPSIIGETEGKGERGGRAYAYFIKMLPRCKSGAIYAPQKWILRLEISSLSAHVSRHRNFPLLPLCYLPLFEKTFPPRSSGVSRKEESELRETQH